MMPGVALVFFLLLTTCSSEKDPLVETRDVEQIVNGKSLSEGSKVLMDSTTIYIDFILRYENSDEFYSGLFLKKNTYSRKIYNFLVEQADSMVYSDMTMKRKRLPLITAKEYFDLSAISTIDVFDKQGNYLTPGTLVRVEYLENSIESQFVAVYKTGKSDFTVGYCIGSNQKKSIDEYVKHTVCESDSLDARVIKGLNLDSEGLWMVKHIGIPDYNKIFSFVSSDTSAYIVDVSAGKLRPLYKSEISAIITEVVTIPKLVNGEPLFLLKFGMPHTDMVWTSLMVFGRGKYSCAVGNRIKL